MRYCNYCQVHIRDNKEKCALCGNTIGTNDNSKTNEKYFPTIKPFYKRHLAIRIMLFISVVSIVMSYTINMIFPSNINWPILVLFGLISMWISLFFIVQKRYHIPKKIIWQVGIISLLSIFWDWKTGWRGWSLDYVIPITCLAAMIIMYVTAKIMKLSINNYITYALLDGLFGIIPILFILFDWVNVKYPSIICVSISIISLSAIFIFHGEDIKAEMSKRMHI